MNWKNQITLELAQIKDIKTHLTPREKWIYGRQGLVCGAWMGITLAYPVVSSFTWPFETPSIFAYFLNGTFFLVGAIGTMFLQKRSTVFLYSTNRAKYRGYNP